ncbi:hypothetical protein JCM8097_006069 [Rhodosporidiobolus ruineniae]
MADSDGSVYEPDEGIPLSAAARALPSRDARANSSQLDFSTNSLAGTPLDYQPETAVGTPVGSEPAEDTTAEATPAPEPAQPVKRSKALNFLKKKEPKTSINIKGTTYQIRDDEIVLPDDPRGEAKIDKNGNLLGGRKWKVHTFTSPLRENPNKVYLLSIDAARCAGFRDSLYFFRRNPLIHKLSCNQPEKDRLIELGRLSGNLKSRAVTMVSARNVFKIMGATFLQDGKYVFDDYYEDKSIAAGHKPGEPAFIEPYDPDKDTGTLATSKGNAPPGATSLGLNVLIGHPGKPKVPGGELISSQIGGGIHATFGGTGLQPFGKSWDPSARKAKPAPHLTPENWMLEYAEAVRETNSELIRVRKGNIGQVQVGLGVEEREEDCWEWVEEEYTDDEDEQPPPRPPQPPAAMQLDPSSAAPSPYAASPAYPGLSAPSPGLAGSSVSPIPGTPVDPSVLYGTPGHLPHLPHPHSALSSAAPSPAPTRPASPTPAPPKPKKKRLIRVYNPIRGVYEPETNVPHVYQATQPTFAEIARVDRRPRLFGDEDGSAAAAVLNGLSGEDRAAKRRKLEDAAAKVGAASIEYVSDERAWALENEDEGEGGEVEALLRARRGREPLVPGQWDFLGGEGVVA